MSRMRLMQWQTSCTLQPTNTSHMLVHCHHHQAAALVRSRISRIISRTTTIPNSSHQQKISLVRASPRKGGKVKRLGRIQINMKVVRHTTVKEVKQGHRNLASASKRKLAISTLRLNGNRHRM